MCNIAAYVGTRRAAPILVEMLRREEGMNAGFFTGLATIHEGRIHYRKIEGDLDYLLAHTDVEQLPGTIGFIHGRTPGYGGDAWSHPFLGRRNGEDEIAVIANGAIGFFEPNAARYDELARKLDREGYEFGTRKMLTPTSMRVLESGESVHSTDLQCQLILRNMNGGADEVDAMGAALCEMPIEMVVLMLSRKHPDRIFWSLMNKPMKRALSSHGTYLATCAIAFPEDAGDPLQLPHLSCGFVTANGVYAKAFPEAPASIAPIDAAVTAVAYKRTEELLGAGEHTLQQIVKEILPLFPKADIAMAVPLAYDILYTLHRAGRLRIREDRFHEAPNERSAPIFYMSLTK